MQELSRIDNGQLLVMRISAELAPRSALTSSSVWRGRYFDSDLSLGFNKSAVSRVPPKATMRSPSEVLVIDLLPRKYRFGHTSSLDASR